MKPLALLLGPLVLVVAVRRGPRRWRDTVWGIGLAAGLIVLAYLPFWEGPSTLQGLSRGHLFTASPAQLLVVRLEAAGWAPEAARSLASSVASGLFLVPLAGLLAALWSGRLPIVAAAVATFVLYLLLAAQWFNPWYLLWLAPLVALVPERGPRVLGLAFTLLAPLVYLFHHRPLPVVLTVFLPMAILAVWQRA